jgi:hypothetical protein
MAEQTPLEEEALSSLEKKAKMLTNGKRGDLDHLCEVVAELTGLFIASIRTGFMTAEDCRIAQHVFLGTLTESVEKKLKNKKSGVPAFLSRTPLAVLWGTVPHGLLVFLYFVGKGKGWW